MPRLHVVSRRDVGSAEDTRHWLDIATVAGGRTAVTAGAIAITVPHPHDLVGWLKAESQDVALLDPSPAKALATLGGLLDGSAVHSAAALHAVYDSSTDTITLASAGYGTALLITPAGLTEIVAPANDRLLGGDAARYPPVTAAFPVGSSLVVHAHSPGCPSRGPSDELLSAEIGETRLFARGPTAQGTLCESLARTFRCDDKRDESIVLLLTAEDDTVDGEPVRRFAGVPESAAAARAFTLRALDEWRLLRTANRAAVIVGELSANAIRHASTPFDVRLIRGTSTVTVEVTDASPEPPQPVEAGPYDSGHRGLLIVETLAERWGVRETGTGKTIWAEIGLETGPGATRAEKH